jgi:hypothetical protein
MMHGNVASMDEHNISNMGASKWSKMTNMSHGASSACSKIHNMHAQEGCHLKSASLCIFHNAKA